MKTRILACFLSVLMLVSMIPVSVSAEKVNDAKVFEVSDAATFNEAITFLNDNDCVGGLTINITKDIEFTSTTPNVSGRVNGYNGDKIITINGNNHKLIGITNMLIYNTWGGSGELIINDLTIVDANIVSSSSGVAAFVGYTEATRNITLKNCHLLDSTVDGADWTGGFIGYAAGFNGNGSVFEEITITGGSVKGSTIISGGSAGAIAGHGTGNVWTHVNINGTEITGNTITCTDDSKVKAGIVVGTIGTAGPSAVVDGTERPTGMTINVTESGNTVTSGGETITRIAGRGPNGKATVTGGSYTDPSIYSDSNIIIPDNAVLTFPDNIVPFEMEDFDLWGDDWFGAFNVGWKYAVYFNPTTITSLEVGMKDPDGNLIIKYNASGDQLTYQSTNGYINATTKQSSAPFYKEYEGTAIVEGADLDWTVTKGEQFDAWNVATCYVTVSVGENDYTLTKTSSHVHNFVEEYCDACGADISCPHNTGVWMRKDETHHWFECQGCGEIQGEKAEHYVGTDAEYSKDETHHWHVCAEQGCYSPIDREEHTFAKGVCTICGAEEEGYIAPPAFDYILFALAARYAQKYDIIVTSDNATVTGDLAIKYKRNGTVDIAVADGYKVVDVIANGISLGVVDSVTFKQVKAPQTLVVITEKLYTNPYSDITDDNAAVQYVTENGLMTTAEEGLFAPETEATRALLAEVLYALAGKPEVDATVTVNDAEDAAILWAAATGILTPNADGLVEPDTVITLADLNAALNAYAGTTDVVYVEFDAETEVAATRADLANAIYLFCTIPAEG